MSQLIQKTTMAGPLTFERQNLTNRNFSHMSVVLHLNIVYLFQA